MSAGASLRLPVVPHTVIAGPLAAPCVRKTLDGTTQNGMTADFPSPAV